MAESVIKDIRVTGVEKPRKGTFQEHFVRFCFKNSSNYFSQMCCIFASILKISDKHKSILFILTPEITFILLFLYTLVLSMLTNVVKMH